MDDNKKQKKFGIKFNAVAVTYAQSQDVPVLEGCTAFMFTNIGDTIASVNGMVIFPSLTPLTNLGDSRSISAHDGDIYKGNIRVAFLQPLGAAPLIEIVQVYYLADRYQE